MYSIVNLVSFHDKSYCQIRMVEVALQNNNKNNYNYNKQQEKVDFLRSNKRKETCLSFLT